MKLSRRETEIMALVAQGLGDKEIADRLSLMIGTVHGYLKRIFRKLGARNRAHAAILWSREDCRK